MDKLHEQIKYIEEKLNLSLNIQAVKMIEKEEDIPASAVRASERYKHMAFCQAQTLTKKLGQTTYIGIKDEWCWAPLVGFGQVDCSPETPAFAEISKFIGIADYEGAKEFFANFPRLPLGKYIGTVVGPASTCDYDPDIILINTDNNFQMRQLCSAIKQSTGKLLETKIDSIDSCIYTIVKPMLNHEYSLTMPDIGETERANAGANELILGFPTDRLPELISGLEFFEKIGGGYRQTGTSMDFDFARPSFYNRIYELWGLETGEVWDREK